MLKIWLITIGEILPFEENEKKQRTTLLSEKLIERGHDVIWWSSAFNHFKKAWLVKKDSEMNSPTGLKFILLKGFGYKKNISFSRFIDHRIIAWKFFRKASKMDKPDIIIVSMPTHDFAYQAVRFSRDHNIPVLVDIRDPWPDIFVEQLPKMIRTIGKLFLYNDFRMLKKTMQLADGLIAASGTFMEWGLAYAERKISENDKVFFLGYKKPKELDYSLVNPKFIELEKSLRNKFIVFFVGTFSKSYHNPLILINVANRMTQYTDIHFVIAGDGELFEDLKIASEFNSNVTLPGWLKEQDIGFWLKHSKIGICPTTKIVDLPTNKAFSYLSAGLPIISAFHGFLKEIITKYNIGFYYPPNDVDELISCILKLYLNKELYNTQSINSKNVFDELFDADKIYNQYANHIEKMGNIRVT